MCSNAPLLDLKWKAAPIGLKVSAEGRGPWTQMSTSFSAVLLLQQLPQIQPFASNFVSSADPAFAIAICLTPMVFVGDTPSPPLPEGLYYGCSCLALYQEVKIALLDYTEPVALAES